jgi:hypothetical protein
MGSPSDQGSDLIAARRAGSRRAGRPTRAGLDGPSALYGEPSSEGRFRHHVGAQGGQVSLPSVRG